MSVTVIKNTKNTTKNTNTKERKMRKDNKDIVVELWLNDEKKETVNCTSLNTMWKAENELFDLYPEGRELIYMDGILTYDLHCEMIGGRRWKKNAIAETRRKHKKNEAETESTTETETKETEEAEETVTAIAE